MKPGSKPSAVVDMSITTTSEQRLKRFIHFAQETLTYLPGERFKTQFDKDSLTAVNDLVAENKIKDITNIILKAFTDGYSVQPEALVFALAVTARQTTSEELRTLAYSTARNVCKSPSDFFLFVKFCSQLAPGKGVGTGLKKFVKNWYTKQEPLALLTKITEHTSWHGWCHKDIITLCHFTEKDNIALSAIIQYVCKGFFEMKREFSDKPEARQVVNYLQALEDFRAEEDRTEAARMIDTHKFSFEQLPHKMIRLKWIWPLYVPKLPLRDLLANLKRLGHMRLINDDEPLAAMVIDALTNLESIAKSELHPAEVMVAMRHYERLTVLDPLVKKSAPSHTTPEKQLPLKVNPKIMDALESLLNSTFKLLVPTGLRYMVIVDVRPEMATGKCYHNNAISPLMASAVVALSLVKTERSVVVGTYGNNNTVHTIRISKNMTLSEAFAKLRAIQSCPVDLSQPINWAKNKSKEFDVFVLLTDHQVHQTNMMSPAKAIGQYRKKQKRQNIKLIVCGLGCITPFKIADPSDSGILEIVGFDGKVPRVIEAFSRGAF